MTSVANKATNEKQATRLRLGIVRNERAVARAVNKQRVTSLVHSACFKRGVTTNPFCGLDRLRANIGTGAIYARAARKRIDAQKERP